MKTWSIISAALLLSSVFAVEIQVDGDFNDLKRHWSLSSTRNGVVEVIRLDAVNCVQLASECNPRGQIGIYTARGIAAKCGDKFTVSADIQGAPIIISIMEYGDKKFLASQDKRFENFSSRQNCTAAFTVSNPKTDLVRISFKVVKGAVAVVSRVKVYQTSGDNNK